MNVLRIPEADMVPDLANLHPIMTMPSKIAPIISDIVRPPSTIMLCSNNWLVYDDDIEEEDWFEHTSRGNVSYDTESRLISWE